MKSTRIQAPANGTYETARTGNSQDEPSSHARTVSVDNLDIFTYVNSKFVYVEKHIKIQLTRLYQDIMEQKCTLERQILQNELSFFSIAPDEMAFRIMRSPRYTVVKSGEVIHLIKCIQIECRIWHTDVLKSYLSSTGILPTSKIKNLNYSWHSAGLQAMDFCPLRIE